MITPQTNLPLFFQITSQIPLPVLPPSPFIHSSTTQTYLPISLHLPPNPNPSTSVPSAQKIQMRSPTKPISVNPASRFADISPGGIRLRPYCSDKECVRIGEESKCYGWRGREGTGTWGEEFGDLG